MLSKIFLTTGLNEVMKIMTLKFSSFMPKSPWLGVSQAQS